MKILSITLGILLLIVGSGDAQGTFDKEATKSFDSYLSQCPQNELRCIWFLNDQVGIGMKMTIDLEKHSVLTFRHVYNFARQATKIRELSRQQVITLKSLIVQMPKSVKSGKRVDSVFVSYRKDDKVEVRRFHRVKLPREVERLYDIGGGYIETPAKENKPLRRTDK